MVFTGFNEQRALALDRSAIHADAERACIHGRAPLDTTTKPAVNSLPPHDGEVGRVRERGFQKSATIRWNELLSTALSPLVPRWERGHFSDGACIKMRPLAEQSMEIRWQPVAKAEDLK